MARRPSHVVAALSRPEGRDVIWQAIRKLRMFTILHVEHETRINTDTIKSYLHGLTHAGYLAVVSKSHRDGRGRQTPQVWKLERDAGVEAPRVTRDGKPVVQGQARQQMWVTMRALKTFTYVDLAASASTEACQVAVPDAKDYCKHLAQARYLVVAEPGRSRKPAVYRFVKYTGPKAPQVQRIQQVFDPNLKRVVTAQEARA